MEVLPSFVVAPVAGFAPQIGRLVAMMGFARWTTVRTVQGLTVEQLDHLHDERSNSIGALLAHIAAIEVSYQRITFGGRGAELLDGDAWQAAVDLGPLARRVLREKPLEHYVELLDSARQFTLRELASRTDEWLDETTPFWNARPANNYFKWFHVFEDELNHRGQIRWLRQRVPRGGG